MNVRFLWENIILCDLPPSREGSHKAPEEFALPEMTARGKFWG